MVMSPKISVLMSVYNGQRYLRQAVESILGQTFRDFEFIIVDDGSTDSTGKILAGYDDPRIKCLNNDRNMGLSRSLNRGLDLASGIYIARMDADDVAEPPRLERQKVFLDTNLEIGLCGSNAALIDDGGRDAGKSERPLNDIEIRWRCLTGNPFFHPTVMIRRGVLVDSGLAYDETFETAQDYDLWARVLERTKAANMPERLVRIRAHEHSLSGSRPERQAADHARVALRAIDDVWPGHPLTPASFPLLRRLVSGLSALEGYADNHRIRLLGFYAELLGRFAEKHRRAKGLGALCRRERILIAYTAFKTPWRPGLLGLLAGLVAADPLLPVYGVMRLVRGTMCRLACRRR